MNVVLIPKIGYTGAAWTTFTAYGVMAILSYVFGNRFYPVPYDKLKIIGYVVLAVTIWGVSEQLTMSNSYLKYAANTGLLIVFTLIIVKLEWGFLKRFIK